jgi:hypothetical protein
MKKLILILIVLSIPGFACFAQSYALGDINHSGSIDIVDALLIAQKYVGLNPLNFDANLSDVNASGGTDIVDALLISQYYVGLITQFPGQPGCNGNGRFTYTLARASNPTSAQLNAYTLITSAMDKAITYYNCNTSIIMNINVYYDSSVPTAQANLNGPISFGQTAYMQYITAMHEMSHCAGVGTHSRWASLISNGKFTGTNTTNQLRQITGNQSDMLSADTQHFWPYGLNYTSEVTGEADLINHCKIVVAIRKDLGL